MGSVTQFPGTDIQALAKMVCVSYPHQPCGGELHMQFVTEIAEGLYSQGIRPPGSAEQSKDSPSDYAAGVEYGWKSAINILIAAKPGASYQPPCVIDPEHPDDLPDRKDCLRAGEHVCGAIPAAQALDGASLITAERKRQIEVEGWTPEHDDQHAEGGHFGEPSLPQAAACYALHAHYSEQPSKPAGWPWDAEYWKPASPIRMLVKAGALIAAEIDRRLRRGEQP